MAALTYKQVKITGTDIAATAADAGGDLIPANDRGFLFVKNDSASAITVTVLTPGNTQWGQAQPDVTVSVPAAGYRFIGPLDAALLDPTDKAVKVSYSAVASVVRAAVFI